MAGTVEHDPDEVGSISSRRSFVWALEMMNLDDETVGDDDNTAIDLNNLSSHSRTLAWEDIKGFIAETAAMRQDKGDSSSTTEMDGSITHHRWGKQMKEILELTSLGFQEEKATPLARRLSTVSKQPLPPETVDEALGDLEDSIRDFSYPTTEREGTESTVDSDEPEHTVDDTRESSPLSSIESELAASLNTIPEESLGSSKECLDSTNDPNPNNPQDPFQPKRRRYSRNRKPPKKDDMDWKSIQQIIKDKKVLTSAGVRRIVQESLGELPDAKRGSLGNSSSDKSSIDPEMLKMGQHLTRFSVAETGKHPLMQEEEKRTVGRFMKTFMKGLSTELKEESKVQQALKQK